MSFKIILISPVFVVIRFLLQCCWGKVRRYLKLVIQMLLHQIKVECVMDCVVLVGFGMRWSAEGHSWGHCGTMVNKKKRDIMASRFVP